MTYQCAFDFSGADAVSGYVEDIIGAAEDGDVSIFVFHGNIAGDVASGNVLPVALVAGGITPHCAEHARKRTLQHEPSADVWWNGFAVFIDDVGFCSRHSDSDLAGAHSHARWSAERGPTYFGLPPVVDDITPLAIPGK